MIEPDFVFLLLENDCIALQGRLCSLLAPLLNGQNTVDQIVEKLEGRATIVDVRYGISLLEKGGYIVEGDDLQTSGVAAFRDLLNVDCESFRNRLEGTSVAVTSLGTVPVEPFVALLQSLHIQVAAEGRFRVVLTDDYLRRELEDLNRQTLALNLPWMIVKPVGAILWIGPIFNPKRTACWACLAKRLREHRQLRTPVKRVEAEFPPLSKSLLPSTLHLALDIAATEILKWIVQGGDEAAEGKLITFDVKAATVEQHVVVRQQSCPDCGNARGAAKVRSVSLVLRSQKKVFTSDGGHRAAPPHAVFRRYEHHISPITGIVDSLRAGHEDDRGLVQVFVAELSSAIRRDRGSFWGAPFGSRSVGKGVTEIQAKASALCEALERYSGVFQGDEIRMKASYLALRDCAIHPNLCMNFSRKQYEHRDEWNQRESDFNWVPQPFDEEREIEWTPVWSLTEEGVKYVPTAYCYYAYPVSEEYDFCRADSNGNAAGSTVEEAILQGFMELAERDAVALWWYNRLRRPAVNLDSFNQPYLRALKDYYDALHREIHVLDITNDFCIPAFAAVCKPTREDKRDLLLGFGAHFDPQVAIQRALTEMNQFLPGALRGELPTIFSNEMLDSAFLEGDETVVRTGLEDFSRPWSDDLREDVMACVKLAQKQGLEVLVLDQTRPDIGLHVVKVIVPGLRHFWARFSPGRLYDVPFERGWLQNPLTEGQLNRSHLLL
jgi:ribosomal protein S12 methylthiotransferase accessory factor